MAKAKFIRRTCVEVNQLLLSLTQARRKCDLDSDVEFVLDLMKYLVTHTQGTSLLSLLIREVNGEISLLKIPGLPRDLCIRKGRGQNLSKGYQ